MVRDAWLPGDIAAGDLIAVAATGAYCRSMASNYNHVPRPPSWRCATASRTYSSAARPRTTCCPRYLGSPDERLNTDCALGCGVVGSQVVRLLDEQADDLAARVGAPLELVGIAVRRPARHTDLPAGLVTTTRPPSSPAATST